MKQLMLLITAGGLFFSAGCASVHSGKWEYQTVFVSDGANTFQRDQTNDAWISNDQALNAMIQQGWKVAGFSVYQSDQWFLLKRRKE